jgi:hypothetical protein
VSLTDVVGTESKAIADPATQTAIQALHITALVSLTLDDYLPLNLLAPPR